MSTQGFGTQGAETPAYRPGSKAYNRWNRDKALKLLRDEFDYHGLAEVVHNVEVGIAETSPLGQLYRDTKREIIAYFHEFDRQLVSHAASGKGPKRAPKQNKVGIIKECKAALKDAAAPLGHRPMELPPKSHILACRFVSNNGRLNAPMVGLLMELGRCDLAQIPDSHQSSINQNETTPAGPFISSAIGSDCTQKLQSETLALSEPTFCEQQDTASQTDEASEVVTDTMATNNEGLIERFAERLAPMIRDVRRLVEKVDKLERMIERLSPNSSSSESALKDPEDLLTSVREAQVFSTAEFEIPSSSLNRETKRVSSYSAIMLTGQHETPQDKKPRIEPENTAWIQPNYMD